MKLVYISRVLCPVGVFLQKALSIRVIYCERMQFGLYYLCVEHLNWWFLFCYSKPCPWRISLSEVMDMRRRSVLRAIRMKKPDAAAVCLLMLAVLFLIGGIAGSVYSQTCGDTANTAFREYLSDYCVLYEQGMVSVSLKRSLLLYFASTCLAFLLGFSSLGIVLIPMLSAGFGFISFYTASCFAQAFGSTGILLAAALTAVRLLFTLPTFFLVACEAFPISLRLALLTLGRGKRAESVIYAGKYIVLFLICIVVLCFGVCCERLLTPVLFRSAATQVGLF